MKTNFQMLMSIADFYPENRGFISAREMELISGALEIDRRSELDLRNLRDFVVMFYARPEFEQLKDIGKMSAICAVIDRAIISKGGEV